MVAPLDVAIARVASEQHGVVASHQLRRLGLTSRGERHRVAAGRLHRLSPGVYAVGHPVVTVAGRRLAAVLACGDGAVLSHRSAAAAWGLLVGDAPRWDVTTPTRRSRATAGVCIHRTRRLPRHHVTERGGVPITTVARTLLDLADVVPRRVLARALHEAEVLRLLDLDALVAALSELPGRRGARPLRHVVAQHLPDVHTRSELEVLFQRVVADHDVPTPRVNAHVDVGGRLVEVDALWAHQRVIVELDGEHVHATARAFHADRARDAALAALGYVVLRLTWRRLTREPDAVARELRAVLTARPAPSPPAPPP